MGEIKLNTFCKICKTKFSIPLRELLLGLPSEPVVRISIPHGPKPHVLLVYINRDGKIVKKEYFEDLLIEEEKSRPKETRTEKEIATNKKILEKVLNRLLPILVMVGNGEQVQLRGIGLLKYLILKILDSMLPFPITYINFKGGIIIQSKLNPFQKNKIYQIDWNSSELNELGNCLGGLKSKLSNLKTLGEVRMFLSKIFYLNNKPRESHGVIMKLNNSEIGVLEELKQFYKTLKKENKL